MDIFLFSKWQRPPSWILLQVKSDVTARCGLSMSTIMPNFVTISQTAAEVTSGDVVGCPWPPAHQIWWRYLKKL